MTKRRRPKMHPRNIYKQRQDFKQLAKEFPEFKENTTIELTGEVRLNFKDPVALRVLSKTFLKKDFDLDVDIPPNTLVPTIPLRLNYILFIEDILNLINVKENVKGLDIGTGASCIYPLISAKKNGWFMVGTEINSDSIACAKRNVDVNQLGDVIKVIQVTENSVISEILENDETKYDFCMCNPPFFGNTHELESQSKGRPNRPPPKNAFTAAEHEVVTEGGEVEFVGRLIEESSTYHNRIRVFTSMLGIKRSIKPLMAKLRGTPGIKSTTLTEFFQGRTIRFGIGWTFSETVDLQSLSVPVKLPRIFKQKTYVHYIKSYEGSITEAKHKLEVIFNELELKYATRDNTDTSHSYHIIAYKNMWTHNRKKRRERANANRIKSKQAPETSMSNVGENPDVDTNPENVQKRKVEGENLPSTKRFKSDEGQQADKLLECILTIYKLNSELRIELLFVSGTGGKRASHEVLQHIRNHFKLD